METTVDVEHTPLCETKLKDRNWIDYVLVYEQSIVEEGEKEEGDGVCEKPSDTLESMRKTFEENLKQKGLKLQRLEDGEDTAEVVS